MSTLVTYGSDISSVALEDVHSASRYCVRITLRNAPGSEIAIFYYDPELLDSFIEQLQQKATAWKTALALEGAKSNEYSERSR